MHISLKPDQGRPVKRQEADKSAHFISQDLENSYVQAMSWLRTNTLLHTLGLSLILLTLQSCSLLNTLKSSNLSQIHPSSPIVIIPGAMGSTLINPKTNDVVWGKLVDLEVANPHEALLFPENMSNFLS